MYNEKNEMEKVNFGDLPANWDEEFAEEWESELAPHGQNESNKASKLEKRTRKNNGTK